MNDEQNRILMEAQRRANDAWNEVQYAREVFRKWQGDYARQLAQAKVASLDRQAFAAAERDEDCDCNCDCHDAEITDAFTETLDSIDVASYGMPIPVPVPGLTECSDTEAVLELMAFAQGDKYRAESWQDRYAKLKKAGYVLAKRA